MGVDYHAGIYEASTSSSLNSVISALKNLKYRGNVYKYQGEWIITTDNSDYVIDVESDKIYLYDTHSGETVGEYNSVGDIKHYLYIV